MHRRPRFLDRVGLMHRHSRTKQVANNRPPHSACRSRFVTATAQHLLRCVSPSAPPGTQVEQRRSECFCSNAPQHSPPSAQRRGLHCAPQHRWRRPGPWLLPERRGSLESPTTTCHQLRQRAPQVWPSLPHEFGVCALFPGRVLPAMSLLHGHSLLCVACRLPAATASGLSQDMAALSLGATATSTSTALHFCLVPGCLSAAGGRRPG